MRVRSLPETDSPATDGPASLPATLVEYRSHENGRHTPEQDGAPTLITVDATAFGVCADGSDCTPGIRLALEHCRNIGAHRLTLPNGRYTFRPEFAAEAYVFMSNNDDGLRRIAFLLRDFSGLEIDGQGSDFIFHGLIIPFVVDRSAQVRIKNVNVDWAVPFHCEGQLLSCDETGLELAIPAEFPYQVVNGRFQSLGASAKGWVLHHLLEFDPILGEPARDAEDYYGAADEFRAEETGPGRVRLHGAVASPFPRPGNIIMLSDSRRLCPAFFVTDTDGFTLSDVSIFHAGAMGVIAQRSADLHLARLKVMPRPGGKRLISATADATHFVSCRGRIELSDCLFQTQVDDATNVHGIYMRITSQPTARSVAVQLVHRQQAGTNPVEVGHRLQFVSHETLAPIHEAEVVAVQQLNDEYAVFIFADPIPASVRKDDALLDLFWQPTETIIRRCTARGNRARGFLLSVGGRVLVEGCTFHTPGAAILLEGDANYWFESGPVSDVTIRHNEFICCNYGPWGRAAIQISPGIGRSFHQEPRYHRNIRIEHNSFEVFFPTLFDAQGVDGLRFCDNRVVVSQAYLPKEPEAPPFIVQHCSNVQVTI